MLMPMFGTNLLRIGVRSEPKEIVPPAEFCITRVKPSNPTLAATVSVHDAGVQGNVCGASAAPFPCSGVTMTWAFTVPAGALTTLKVMAPVRPGLNVGPARGAGVTIAIAAGVPEVAGAGEGLGDVEGLGEAVADAPGIGVAVGPDCGGLKTVPALPPHPARKMRKVALITAR